MPLSLDMDYPFCLSGMFSHPIKLSPPPPFSLCSTSILVHAQTWCPEMMPRLRAAGPGGQPPPTEPHPQKCHSPKGIQSIWTNRTREGTTPTPGPPRPPTSQASPALSPAACGRPGWRWGVGRHGHGQGGPSLWPGLGFQLLSHRLTTPEPVSMREITSRRVRPDNTQHG